MENRQNPSPTNRAAALSADGQNEADAPRLNVVLASGSPRRKRLLADAGVNFTVRVSEVDETLDPDVLADPSEAVKKLAERKAGAIVQEILAEDNNGAVAVLGADTVVVCGGEIFGKPVNLSDAKRMLRRLAGVTHEVLTAVSVWLIATSKSNQVSVGFRTFVDRAAVTFCNLSDEDIADYLRKGESFDKAGAYAVQGAGADLVEHIEGDINTVIGLPVERLFKEFPDLKPSSR